MRCSVPRRHCHQWGNSGRPGAIPASDAPTRSTCLQPPDPEPRLDRQLAQGPAELSRTVRRVVLGCRLACVCRDGDIQVQEATARRTPAPCGARRRSEVRPWNQSRAAHPHPRPTPQAGAEARRLTSLVEGATDRWLGLKEPAQGASGSYWATSGLLVPVPDPPHGRPYLSRLASASRTQASSTSASAADQ